VRGIQGQSGFRLAARALGLALAAAGVCVAQTEPEEGGTVNREYAIKAGYLYNFGGYVQWPAAVFPRGDSPLVIGVLGTDPFGGLLDEIARTKKVGGRRIVAKRFASMAAYTPCHILFVASTVSREEEAAAIGKLRGSPVLLVGEDPAFARRGGTVAFFVEENRVRFEINLEACKKRQLKVSSKLLSLAKVVGQQ